MLDVIASIRHLVLFFIEKLLTQVKKVNNLNVRDVDEPSHSGVEIIIKEIDNSRNYLKYDIIRGTLLIFGKREYKLLTMYQM